MGTAMQIKDKVAIVTGAAGGIGAALAEALVDGGAHVVISDIDEARLAATAERIGAVAVAGDASSEDVIARMIATAQVSFGPVDLFFANAGIGDGLGMSATDEQWQQAIDINVLAHVRAARALVPQWVQRGSGYFVTTASAAGLLTQIGSATYSMTKHAAVGFAEWLAVTYGDDGIGVSCLCPMGVDTEMLRSGMTSGGGTGGKVAAAAVTGAGEVLTPREVADQVLASVAEGTFLITPHADVREFMRRKAADHDRWIHGMQRYQRHLMGEV
ncbi:MAG: SDR family oxidoreductase [Janibacter sp.]|jgi:NAD(P)-dependent dehydrogenase (short-subunit alcohol dehydrogenase family)|uniref:SDR family oxidoreductase n=1 Tax=Janibacter limosus TaxID=53458 RepID=UPI000AB6434C|nr:SDR family oxidoreductase [Janibacter limosus]MDN5715969.1 SDR family oxidoreductase [Janibacter sp.]